MFCDITIGQEDMFDHKSPSWGYRELLILTKLFDINGGFMVNGEVKIVVEVGVLEVVGKLDVLEETSIESIDVNEFQVLPSHVEFMNSLFEEHPYIASKLDLENPNLRTTYLTVILSLTDILSQSPKKLSGNDLANAYSTLVCVAKARFKLDWLEKKLEEVGKSRLQEIDEEFKELKQKCTNMEALLEFLR